MKVNDGWNGCEHGAPVASLVFAFNFISTFLTL